MSFTTELKVPPEPAFATLVEAFVADASRRSGLPERSARAVVTAASRGFAQIARKLSQGGDPLRVIASSRPENLEVALVERGLPMDDGIARRVPAWSELGEGLDGLHWCCHGTHGSELRLTVNTPQQTVAVEEQRTATPEPLAPEQAYVVRRFQPEDALGVARAFYRTYGYAYDLPAVYVPARLIELNASGHYTSLVALDASGEVAGHYALAREPGSPVADACGAVVIPEHRGRNLLNRLRAAAEAEAIAQQMAGYYSEPVTDHPRTQSASESFGAQACGITLGEAPRNFLARHMQLAATGQRQSCMLYVKPLRPREPRTVYVPLQHRAIIESVYSRLGLPVNFAAGRSPAGGPGAFHSGITRSDRTATVDVEKIGPETAAIVTGAIGDLRRLAHLGAIYVALPLEDPATPELCQAMESLGFFFSGVGPWMLDGKDALRLQLPLTPIDLGALVVVGEFAKSLLHYIGTERRRVQEVAGVTARTIAQPQ